MNGYDDSADTTKARMHSAREAALTIVHLNMEDIIKKLFVIILTIAVLLCSCSPAETPCGDVVVYCKDTEEYYYGCENCRLLEQWEEDDRRYFRVRFCATDQELVLYTRIECLFLIFLQEEKDDD